MAPTAIPHSLGDMFLETLERISSPTERYSYYKQYRVGINRELQRKAAQESANLGDNLTMFATTVRASQTDLTNVLELSQSEISRIKSGKRGLSPEVADRLKLLLVRR